MMSIWAQLVPPFEWWKDDKYVGVYVVTMTNLITFVVLMTCWASIARARRYPAGYVGSVASVSVSH
jgi:hypothetical protein